MVDLHELCGAQVQGRERTLTRRRLCLTLSRAQPSADEMAYREDCSVLSQIEPCQPQSQAPAVRSFPTPTCCCPGLGNGDEEAQESRGSGQNITNT